MSGRFRVRIAGSGALLFLISAQTSLAQNGNARRNRVSGADQGRPSTGAGDPAGSATVLRTVSGRVVNALTGAPVPRALVNLNSRAVLTDAQGKFSFPAFTDSNGYVQITKPGFTASPTPEAAQQQRVPDLDALLELRLYPNAVLTGIVTGPDGLPLSRMQVRLSRLTFDSTGPRWLGSGFTQTDVHGEYRFDTPAGRYRVSTGYTAHSVERGEAVLPVSFPSQTSTVTEAFDLTSGDLRQIDLRPRVSTPYPVVLTLEGVDPDRGTRVTASTPAGLPFNLQTVQREGGLSTQLPTGTFSLRATHGDRNDQLVGESRVVVTGRGIAQAVIHLVPVPVYPVEVAIEFAPVANQGISASTPWPQQFNLTLRNLNNSGEGFEIDPRLTIRPDKSAQFLVPSGRYRLGGGISGPWYIRAAGNGVTNLLTDDLVVAGDAAGSSIRLIVSNASGRLKGRVTTAGQPAAGWVYLIPQQPSLTPYLEVYLQPDGTYRWSGAPGKYVAVPSAQQVHEDFRNPLFLRKFTSLGREVEIGMGADAVLDLELAPSGVSR